MEEKLNEQDKKGIYSLITTLQKVLGITEEEEPTECKEVEYIEEGTSEDISEKAEETITLSEIRDLKKKLNEREESIKKYEKYLKEREDDIVEKSIIMEKLIQEYEKENLLYSPMEENKEQNIELLSNAIGIAPEVLEYLMENDPDRYFTTVYNRGMHTYEITTSEVNDKASDTIGRNIMDYFSELNVFFEKTKNGKDISPEHLAELFSIGDRYSDMYSRYGEWVKGEAKAITIMRAMLSTCVWYFSELNKQGKMFKNIETIKEEDKTNEEDEKKEEDKEYTSPMEQSKKVDVTEEAELFNSSNISKEEEKLEEKKKSKVKVDKA